MTKIHGPMTIGRDKEGGMTEIRFSFLQVKGGKVTPIKLMLVNDITCLCIIVVGKLTFLR